MPKRKAMPPPPRMAHRIRAGDLVCDRCTRTAPYRGMPQMDMSTAPLHRCGFDARPFHHWQAEDPNHIPLPTKPGPLEQEDDD